jgi:dolichol-phosphate mannosyltransferase
VDYITIVVPCYNEAGNIEPLANALGELRIEECELGFIFVDDGSSDHTWNVITSMAQRKRAITGIKLSRNFGHQAALLAGLSSTSGDAVITMDGDLQHPPQLIPAMIAEWRKGARIVTTTRKEDEKIPCLKRFTSRLFYKVFSYLSNVPLRRGQADFRLLDRKAIETLMKCSESSLFLRGLVSWMGYQTVDLPYSPGKRHAGSTAYSIRRMLKFAFDAIFAFSVIPLRINIVIGAVLMIFSFAYAFYAIIIRILYDTAIASNLAPGWASIIVFIFFLFSMLMIQIGLMGEYLCRVYLEVKNRPRFIISEKI